MSSFHVPSVPRGMLLPGFDTHPVVDEEEDLADPAPPGSHVSAECCLFLSVYHTTYNSTCDTVLIYRVNVAV